MSSLFTAAKAEERDVLVRAFTGPCAVLPEAQSSRAPPSTRTFASSVLWRTHLRTTFGNNNNNTIKLIQNQQIHITRARDDIQEGMIIILQITAMITLGEINVVATYSRIHSGGRQALQV